jgi:ATP-binding cassette subfamily B multidrug efflux pump
MVNAIINAGIIAVGSYFLIGNVNVGVTFLVGDLSAFLTYAANYMQPFNEISDVVTEIDYAFASFKRIDDAVHLKRDVNAGTKVLSGKIDNSRSEEHPFLLRSFPRDHQRLHPADPSRAQDRLGRADRLRQNHAHQSLLRFYDPQKAPSTPMGFPTRTSRRKRFRAHIGMVLQDTWIFSGTVYENIAYAKPSATPERRSLSAAERPKAAGFIERLPKGYDTLDQRFFGLIDRRKTAPLRGPGHAFGPGDRDSR